MSSVCSVHILSLGRITLGLQKYTHTQPIYTLSTAQSVLHVKVKGSKMENGCVSVCCNQAPCSISLNALPVFFLEALPLAEMK